MKFTAKVRDVSQQGLGVVDHPDGRVFFVRGVWPGDSGEFEITKQKKRYGFAKLVELQQPSEDRVDVPCQYQGSQEGTCGGCPWMMAAYSSQLKHKQHIITQALKRAKIETTVHPILAATETQAYRNRAQFKTNGQELGFVEGSSKHIVDVESCLVLNQKCNETLKGLRSSLPNSEWQASGKFHWNFIEIDDHCEPGKIKLNKRLPFRQANSAQNKIMKEWLYNHLEGTDFSNALELFCGSGNFTEELSRAGMLNILALEIDSNSIKALKQKRLPGVEAHCLDLDCTTPSPTLIDQTPIDVLVLDPPREGFKKLNSWVKKLKSLQKIFYISCDLDSLIKDISKLLESDWQMTELQPIDAFPHTPHIEVMCVLERS